MINNKPLKNKVCISCNEEYVPNSGRQVFCTPDCRRSYENTVYAKEYASKVCSRCKTLKEATKFRVRTNNKRYLSSMCKDCESKSFRQWQIKNPEKAKLMQRRNDLRISYGITPEEYDALLEKQEGLCAICRTSENQAGRKYFSVDHDHITGKIRGLLCSGCNVGLGYFKDSPLFLTAAIAYLNN